MYRNDDAYCDCYDSFRDADGEPERDTLGACVICEDAEATEYRYANGEQQAMCTTCARQHDEHEAAMEDAERRDGQQ